MNALKKGDKVTVDWPSKDLYNEPGKIVQKVANKDYPVSSTMGRTGDWWLVDFGGYDGLLKVYQDYITKESNNSPMKQFEEFMPVNENLPSLNFLKLSAAQVEQALENGGYSDNRIQKAKFKKMSNSQFVYSISYETDDEEDSGEGEVYVYIDKDGSIKAEWGKRIYY